MRWQDGRNPLSSVIPPVGLWNPYQTSMKRHSQFIWPGYRLIYTFTTSAQSARRCFPSGWRKGRLAETSWTLFPPHIFCLTVWLLSEGQECNTRHAFITAVMTSLISCLRIKYKVTLSGKVCTGSQELDNRIWKRIVVTAWEVKFILGISMCNEIRSRST